MKGYAFGLVGLLIAVAFQLYVKDNRRKQEELALKPSIKLDDRAYVDRLKLEDMLLRVAGPRGFGLNRTAPRSEFHILRCLGPSIACFARLSRASRFCREMDRVVNRVNDQ